MLKRKVTPSLGLSRSQLTAARKTQTNAGFIEPTKLLSLAVALAIGGARPLAGICTLFVLSTPATAKALRPVIKTELALKNLRMSMPIEFQKASTENTVGLTSEPADVRSLAMQQAKDYIAFRHGQMHEAKWEHTCNSAQLKHIENYFCKFEDERKDRVRVRALPPSHTERRDIAALLKEGKFNELSTRSYADIVASIGLVGDLPAIAEVGARVLAQNGCVPPTVTAALGYKLEEGFPDPALITASTQLYKQAKDCGSDTAAANASFRLGLIEISQHNCADIKELMLKVEKTPGASTYHARAQYWRYYCAAQLGDAVAQQDAKDALLHDHPLSFQNLAASGDDSAALTRVLRSEDPEISLRSLIRPDLNPLLRAAEALFLEKENALAVEILERNVVAIAGFEPEVRLYSAMLLSRMGAALPKFKILTSLFDEVPRMVSKSTMKLYFPLWYFDLVNTKQTEIDPLLLLSLIRQESAFNRQARSIVGARGLMQVMPLTARMMTSKRTNSLYDPKTNINVGTKYLLKRLHQYSGDVELTLAAYNAGFGRVDNWRKRYPTENKMLFLDSIPFRETRDYVSMILRNYYWYVKLYDQDSLSSPSAPATLTPAPLAALAENKHVPEDAITDDEAGGDEDQAGEIENTASTVEPAAERAPAFTPVSSGARKTLAIMSANAGRAAGLVKAK
jgi:soluble lytic murein transglycosylase